MLNTSIICGDDINNLDARQFSALSFDNRQWLKQTPSPKLRGQARGIRFWYRFSCVVLFPANSLLYYLKFYQSVLYNFLWFGMFFAHVTHSHWFELSPFRLIERHPEKDESRRRLALHVATLQRDRERGDNRTINFISLAGKRFETKQYQPWLWLSLKEIQMRRQADRWWVKTTNAMIAPLERRSRPALLPWRTASYLLRLVPVLDHNGESARSTQWGGGR